MRGGLGFADEHRTGVIVTRMARSRCRARPASWSWRRRVARHSHRSRYLRIPYRLRACADRRFAPGRAAEVLVGADDTPAGVIGELHPEALASWAIQMPCAACELELETLEAAVS